jgi:hypothetical protein
MVMLYFSGDVGAWARENFRRSTASSIFTEIAFWIRLASPKMTKFTLADN